VTCWNVGRRNGAVSGLCGGGGGGGYINILNKNV
jgi:galactokinase/mevalonate kinase-like predicted kinase